MEDTSSAPLSNTTSNKRKNVSSTKRRSKKSNVERKKQPGNAYNFFVQDCCSKISEEHPEAKFPALGKLMGERWRSLAPEEKAPFQQKAEEDKIRFEKEQGAGGEAKDDILLRRRASATANKPEDGKEVSTEVIVKTKGKRSKDRKSKQGFQLENPNLLKQAYRKMTSILEMVEENIGRDPSMIPTFEGLHQEMTFMLGRIRTTYPSASPLP